jgi:hypothetical protein
MSTPKWQLTARPHIGFEPDSILGVLQIRLHGPVRMGKRPIFVVVSV